MPNYLSPPPASQARPLLAHSHPGGALDDGHLLSEHLAEVERLARRNADAFGLGAFAALMARCHDLGKATPAFQRRVRGAPERVEHSTAGGAFLLEQANARVPTAKAPYRTVAELAAAGVLGHHTGLPDKSGSEASFRAKIDRYTDPCPHGHVSIGEADLDAARAELAAKAKNSGGVAEHLWFRLAFATRMAFSALIDADRCDTENYRRRCLGQNLRSGGLDLASPAPIGAQGPRILDSMRCSFDAYMARFGTNTPLNRTRAAILAHARASAAMEPGFFTMTVPTGGGKTLASMGFALDHAEAHDKKRVIYVAPFTSIIDQTADNYRRVFGDELVLEHHSGVEPQDDEDAHRLRTLWEDWRAPLVVTTAVQFFETLFAAHPSRLRKLASVANAVIVIDEVQTLPRGLLRPILEALRVLVTDYGCSIVLCTATQPGLDGAALGRQAIPLSGRELAPDPEALFTELQRCRIVHGGVMSDDEVLDDLSSQRQALVIVNSRRHALALWSAAKARGLEGAVHLSTRQCPVDRRRILARIREDLKAGLPCVVFATSLVEAGVDIDFPRVWRASTGLDQLIQAGGRCNREGCRPLAESIVTLFEPAAEKPRGAMAGLADDLDVVRRRQEDLGSLQAIEAFFAQLNRRTSGLLDEHAILDLLGCADLAMRTASEKFRMIETTMVPVVIPLDDRARRATQEVVTAGRDARKAVRDLQHYTVGVPEKDARRLLEEGKASWMLQDARDGGMLILSEMTIYSREAGLRWEETPL